MLLDCPYNGYPTNLSLLKQASRKILRRTGQKEEYSRFRNLFLYRNHVIIWTCQKKKNRIYNKEKPIN